MLFVFTFTARIRSSTRSGMMILPPLSLPYGGQIGYVHPTTRHSHSRTSSTKHRSLSKHNNEQSTTTA